MCGARSHAPSCMQLAAAVAAHHALEKDQEPAAAGLLVVWQSCKRRLHDGWQGLLQGHVWCEEPCSIMHAAGCCCGCPSCTVEKIKSPQQPACWWCGSLASWRLHDGWWGLCRAM